MAGKAINKHEIARRYLRALMQSITQKHAESAVQEQLLQDFVSFAQDLGQSFEFKKILNSNYTLKTTEAILGALFKQAALDSVLQNFLSVLMQKNRLNCLHEITQKAQDVLWERQGKIFITLHVARPLNDKETEIVSGQIQEIFQKTPVIQVFVKPELLSGYQVQIKNKLFDFSGKTQLNILQKTMKGVH